MRRQTDEGGPTMNAKTIIARIAALTPARREARRTATDRS